MGGVMAKYIIVGASIETGVAVRVTVEAATPMAAAEQAQAMRIAVSQIDIEAPRPTAPLPPPPQPPQRLAAAPHPAQTASLGVIGAAASGFMGSIGAVAGLCVLMLVCCLGCMGWMFSPRDTPSRSRPVTPQASAQPPASSAPSVPPRSEWVEPSGKLKADLKVCNDKFGHTRLQVGGQTLWPQLVVTSAVITGSHHTKGNKERAVGVLFEFEWRGDAFSRNVFRGAVEDASGKTIAHADMCSRVRYAPGAYKFEDVVFVPADLDVGTLAPALWVW